MTANRVDYRPIHALFQYLPIIPARWTADERQRWLAALEKNVDLCIDVEEPTPTPAPALEEAQ